MLIEPLLGLPEMSCLLNKCGSRSQPWKPSLPVATKILPQAHIRIQPQKLTYHFHRDHFAIGSLRRKTPLAQTPISQKSFQVVFYPAKHRDDKVF
jgi:hypothetical protein